MKPSQSQLISRILPPVLLLALLLLVWQMAVWWFRFPAYQLPGPLAVVSAVVRDFRGLSIATWMTARAAFCGFLASLVVGTVVAFAFSQSSAIRRSCYPYAIFLQTVPIIAIAPLIISWFGFGFQSVVVVTFIVSVFPIITNGTTGMLAIDPDLLDLFRLNNASRRQVLFKLRLPNSVPHIITGARTSSGLAVIGAIVGEYFAGYSTDAHGLAYLIFNRATQLRSADLFAAVIASTVLGIAIFGSVSLIGSAILRRWYHPPSETSSR